MSGPSTEPFGSALPHFRKENLWSSAFESIRKQLKLPSHDVHNDDDLFKSIRKQLRFPRRDIFSDDDPKYAPLRNAILRHAALVDDLHSLEAQRNHVDGRFPRGRLPLHQNKSRRSERSKLKSELRMLNTKIVDLKDRVNYSKIQYCQRYGDWKLTHEVSCWEKKIAERKLKAEYKKFLIGLGQVRCTAAHTLREDNNPPRNREIKVHPRPVAIELDDLEQVRPRAAHTSKEDKIEPATREATGPADPFMDGLRDSSSDDVGSQAPVIQTTPSDTSEENNDA